MRIAVQTCIFVLALFIIRSTDGTSSLKHQNFYRTLRFRHEQGLVDVEDRMDNDENFVEVRSFIDKLKEFGKKTKEGFEKAGDWIKDEFKKENFKKAGKRIENDFKTALDWIKNLFGTKKEKMPAPKTASASSPPPKQSTPKPTTTTTTPTTTTTTSTTTTPTTTTTTPTTTPYGCTVDDDFFENGEKIPTDNSCEYCYCIGREVKCTKPQCSNLTPSGCKPVFEEGICCPVRFTDCPETK